MSKAAADDYPDGSVGRYVRERWGAERAAPAPAPDPDPDPDPARPADRVAPAPPPAGPPAAAPVWGAGIPELPDEDLASEIDPMTPPRGVPVTDPEAPIPDEPAVRPPDAPFWRPGPATGTSTPAADAPLRPVPSWAASPPRQWPHGGERRGDAPRRGVPTPPAWRAVDDPADPHRPGTGDGAGSVAVPEQTRGAERGTAPEPAGPGSGGPSAFAVGRTAGDARPGGAPVADSARGAGSAAEPGTTGRPGPSPASDPARGPGPGAGSGAAGTFESAAGAAAPGAARGTDPARGAGAVAGSGAARTSGPAAAARGAGPARGGSAVAGAGATRAPGADGPADAARRAGAVAVAGTAGAAGDGAPAHGSGAGTGPDAVSDPGPADTLGPARGAGPIGGPAEAGAPAEPGGVTGAREPAESGLRRGLPRRDDGAGRAEGGPASAGHPVEDVDPTGRARGGGAAPGGRAADPEPAGPDGHRPEPARRAPAPAGRGNARRGPRPSGWTDPGAVAAQEAQRARTGHVDLGASTDLSSARLLRPSRRPPQSGWRRLVYVLSGKLINPGESPADIRKRELTARVNQPLLGCYKIAMLSLKGGVGKTTMTATLGATFASLRGDRVVAVDANPDRGTLSQKIPLETTATVRHLLRDAQRVRRYTDVRAYTSQGPSRLEVLASEQDPAVSEAFSEDDYRRTVNLLEHFYNIVLTDCGTGLMHSAMYGVLGVADQLIIVSSGSIDGARSASATMDWLDAHGHTDLVANSVAVINCVHRRAGGVDLDRVAEHFALRCRAVVKIPFDAHLEEGAEIDLDRLEPATRLGLLELAASVADGFPS